MATEQRGTGMSLTQNAPVMTQALGTVVQVPRLPLHKVPAVQRLTHLMSPLGQGYNHISRTGGAAIPLPEHWGATGGPRAGDEGTHFLSPVAVTETTPVVPGIPVLVMLTVPRQTRLPHRILVIKLGGVILISVFTFTQLTALLVHRVSVDTLLSAGEQRTLVAATLLAAIARHFESISTLFFAVCHGWTDRKRFGTFTYFDSIGIHLVTFLAVFVAVGRFAFADVASILGELEAMRTG